MPNGGYVWWYLDALSDDGERGITLIAFIGSVFSPYYAFARRARAADPHDHCALNVALYDRRVGRWAMTERGARQLRRDASTLTIGPSALSFDGRTLEVSIDERCAPLPRRLRGEIRLEPTALLDRSFLLDSAGRHRWTPYAPCARIEVELTHPRLAWSGNAYLDSNCGAEPLEAAFRDWTWSRAGVGRDTVVLYDVQERDRSRSALALRFDPEGRCDVFAPPPVVTLPRTGWRLARSTRADAGFGARVARSLEDAPFYSRSVLDTHLLGRPGRAIHESLDLERFSSLWVQCLLPFRMPRWTS